MKTSKAKSGNLQVKVKREKIAIKTYGVGEPEKNPMFFERRVYQGSCGKVYPVPFIDKVFDKPGMKEYDAVTLENEYVRLVLLPELGGRIYIAQDKKNGNYDFFYRNDVIKPALVGLAGPWVSGGVEFNWPQHHRPATFMPTDVEIKKEWDGSVTVWMSDHDPLTRMRGTHGICLKPGSCLVELKARLYNRTPFTQTFLWWANVAARVHDKYESFFPPDVEYVADHAVRAMTTFPESTGIYYGVDYSKRRLQTPETSKLQNSETPKSSNLCWYKNIPVPTSYMICATKFDFFGGYDHAAQGGFVHVADRHIAPGKKQWTWGNHPFGYAWDRELTDDSGPYIELMAGVYTDNQPDFSYLMPYETKAFSQYWWPYQKIGVPQNANTEAAVRFAKGSIGVAVSRPMKGVTIRVMRGGKAVKEVKVDLSPEKPWIAEERVEVVGSRVPRDRRQQAHAGKAGDVLVLLDAEGNEVIRCSAAAPSASKPRPLEKIKDRRPVATEPPAPKDIASADELFLTAEHLDQYRHPTRAPEAYLDELLQRDPGDCRAHILYGKRLFSRGLFKEAKDHFAAAVARLTFRHPNPYTGEAHYYLGLTLDFLGDDAAAYDAYAKAAWDAAWVLPAEARMAVLRARRGDRSLVAAIAARLERDPLDHLACWISLCWVMGGGDRERFLKYTRNDAQTVLDVAYDLIDMGMRDDAKYLLELHLKSGWRASSRTAGAGGLMVKYVLEWLKGAQAYNSKKGCRADRESPDWFFPSRLWDYRVLRDLWDRGNRSRNVAYGLGNFLYDRKRHEEALAMWKAAVKADPSFPTAWRNLGVALWNVRRDAKGALAAYRKAMKANPKDARLVAEYDQLCEKCKTPVAKRLKFLEERAALVAVRDDATVQYVTCLNDVDRHEDALNVLASRRFHPWEGGEGKVLRQYTRAHLELGFKALGRAASSKPLYHDALRHAELALDTPQNLGEAYHLLQAKADVNYLRGMALRGLGREDEAKAAFTAAAEEAGDFQAMAVTEYSELSYYRGLALAALGRKKEAKALFRGMKAFAEKGLKAPFKIDYFATSLPLLLIFDDDLEAVKNERMKTIAALAEKGMANV
jgi:tetratricopeptide (TPR) repeat protein